MRLRLTVALTVALTQLSPALGHAGYEEFAVKSDDVEPLLGSDVALSGSYFAVTNLKIDSEFHEARVYRLFPSGDWQLHQILDGNDDEGWPNEDTPSFYDVYGQSVAMDSTWLFVNDPVGGLEGHGRVYAYRRSGSTFSLNQVIDAPASSWFGSRMAVNNNTAVIGDDTHLWVYRYLGVWNGQYFVLQWVLDDEIVLPRASDRFSTVATQSRADPRRLAPERGLWRDRGRLRLYAHRWPVGPPGDAGA